MKSARTDSPFVTDTLIPLTGYQSVPILRTDRAFDLSNFLLRGDVLGSTTPSPEAPSVNVNRFQGNPLALFIGGLGSRLNSEEEILAHEFGHVLAASAGGGGRYDNTRFSSFGSQLNHSIGVKNLQEDLAPLLPVIRSTLQAKLGSSYAATSSGEHFAEAFKDALMAVRDPSRWQTQGQIIRTLEDLDKRTLGASTVARYLLSQEMFDAHPARAFVPAENRYRNALSGGHENMPFASVPSGFPMAADVTSVSRRSSRP